MAAARNDPVKNMLLAGWRDWQEVSRASRAGDGGIILGPSALYSPGRRESRRVVVMAGQAPV